MKESMVYQEGLISLPIYSATSALVTGQGLLWGNDGGTYNGSPLNALVTIADEGADIFGVLHHAPTTQTTNIQTPISYQGKVQLVSNCKIWRVYYDMRAAYDASVDSYSSPTITVAACDQDLDGSWVYVNSGAGAGELRYIKTADATTLTANTAFTSTLTSASDFILIRPPGRTTGGHTLDTTFSMMDTVLDGGNTTGIIVLKNFMEGAGGSWELDITKNSHCEMDGLSTRGVRFYSDIVFMDTAFGAAGLS